ncbi:uncharacterized protein LOC130265422 isoform X1 [Oenanthe melanoleuca]|uniref:uncharacterized protein LOC130265422 isoform X1 n=1 Tax=Oenanthe melanoleuca TaxID=2939378 RepID=UPI0024C1912A|nr:uncharacterized protein LOC130265422 isoform X1 [Oenanthe melanoleuca]
MAGRALKLLRVFRGMKIPGPAVVLAQQSEEPEQLQPLLDDADMEETQEQDPARGHFHRAAQTLKRFLHTRRRKSTTKATEGAAEADSRLSEKQAKPAVSTASTECTENSHRAMVHTAVTQDVAIMKTDTEVAQDISSTNTTPTLVLAPSPDLFKQMGVYSQQQVPAMVRDIHQRLVSRGTVDAHTRMNILSLAKNHPAQVVLTLLRCAPSCDRAAAMMWRTIGSWGPAAESVFPRLLSVMQDWPLHSRSTSSGDNRAAFALAATVVLWVIAKVPECQHTIKFHSAHLLVSLLFQVFVTTEQIPEEVDNFWRVCREEHCLPTKPNRFVVQNIKALLCRLWCDDEGLLALERKRVWDTLLCADTHHYAVGLLAREVRRGLSRLCTPMTICLLKLLTREQPHWDLPGLALLVEFLDVLDLNVCARRVLTIMSKHLQSECTERRRLALRGFVALSKSPLMAESLCEMSPEFLELLRHADGEVVRMTLSVFMNVLQDKDILVSTKCSTTAPMLAEMLVPLFNNDNRHVQLLSIQLFQKVMELRVKKGKQLLKAIVKESLLSLLPYWHDENQDVAEASYKTLLCASRLLKRRDLEQLLTRGQALKFNDGLPGEDESRAPEHLSRALLSLQSPPERQRGAARRFIGIFRHKVTGQQQELQPIREALQVPGREEVSPPLNAAAAPDSADAAPS